MSKQAEFDKINLLGVEVDAISNTDAINYICAHAMPGHPAAYVVKPYVEFLDRAYADESLRDLLNLADLSIADGVALVWAAHFLYAGPRHLPRFVLTLFEIVFAPSRLRWPLPDRAAGINFTWPLLERAGGQKLRVYLIGKETGVEIDQVTAAIQQRVPGIIIAGAQSGRDDGSEYGQVSDEWLERIAADIRTAQADLVLVGMGFPLQERVCDYLAAHLDHGVFVGEGGTFDYASFGGSRAKAPAWMQRSGLEWLWRLILEPSRLTRQLAIPRFIYRIWRSR